MWNYRLVRRKFNKETFYGVHEAFYDKNQKVWAITEEPMRVFEDSRAEVLETLATMIKDVLRAPVLDYDKVPEKGAKGPKTPKNFPKDHRKPEGKKR